MNVVFDIDGREAVPVRALPVITYWERLSPDLVASALAWQSEIYDFAGLLSYHCETGRWKAIPALWWENFASRQIRAVHEMLVAQEAAGSVTKEEGYQLWRRRSLEALPAGVIVWKDEFVAAYERAFSSERHTFLRDGKSLRNDELYRRGLLDFNPFVSDRELHALILEGMPQGALVVEAPSAEPEVHQALARHRAQEMGILKVLQNMGLTPTALPKSKPGQPGIKATVRKHLAADSRFVGTKVFEKAWERLRSSGEIADVIK